jgi:hypothetical protein
MSVVLETRDQTGKLFPQQKVSEFIEKHFHFLGSKFRVCNNVSEGGQAGKHSQEPNVY